LVRIGGAVFGYIGFLGSPALLHRTTLKTVFCLHREERPNQPFLLGVPYCLHFSAQVDLLRLTLRYTTSHTLSSNQHNHTPNQNKLYMSALMISINSDNFGFEFRLS
jgi:hypothetical protein